MNKATVVLLPLAIGIAACSEPGSGASGTQAADVGRPAASQTASAQPAPVNTAIPIGEVMAHVVDPAAYKFWGGMGTLYDEKGVHDLSPKTDAEWKTAEDGAATVVIATNALMDPGYAMNPIQDWRRHARNVGMVALRAKAAVEHRNKAEMERIGPELDAACEACHKQFSPSPTINQR